MSALRGGGSEFRRQEPFKHSNGTSIVTVDKSEKRIRQMFGEISPRYDFLNHILSGGTDINWRWRAVRAVPPGEGPILDVCSGTGDLAIAYWNKA
jgi:demethylmenaquinone methyltransferase/2-methoxy-6-polyprenyl-1,4-benzoquinol methylase